MRYLKNILQKGLAQVFGMVDTWKYQFYENVCSVIGGIQTL